MIPSGAAMALVRPGGAETVAHYLKRGWLVLCVGLALLAGPALAGDRALINVIGYSDDANFFAFEEFGIQDGSGFAYSSIYIVDLANDTWVMGTPIRLQADDEATTLGQIRAAVQAQAAENIVAFGIDRPAEFAALIGDGVPGADAQALRFGTPAYSPGDVVGDYQLALSSFPTTAASPCAEWFAIDPLGYQLTLSDGGSARVIHRDEALPRSRGCPMTYRLYGVVLPHNSSAASHAVALISVYPGGFEGPDRRFIAVPLGL